MITYNWNKEKNLLLKRKICTSKDIDNPNRRLYCLGTICW